MIGKMDCQFELPSQITVGTIFEAHCRSNESIDQESWQVLQEDKYALQFLGAQKVDEQNLSLRFTSYRVGEHDLPDVQIFSGENKLSLGPLKFQVQSVLNQNSQEKQEGYGAIGPLGISIPLVVWLLLGAVFLGLSFSLGSFVRRRMQRRALLESLAEHNSALTPLSELHGNLRKISRANDFYHGGAIVDSSQLTGVVQELDRCFRLFVLRKFQVPALVWPDRLILKESGLDPESESLKSLKKTLSELSKAKAAKQLTTSEVILLTELVQKASEELG